MKNLFHELESCEARIGRMQNSLNNAPSAEKEMEELINIIKENSNWRKKVMEILEKLISEQK